MAASDRAQDSARQPDHRWIESHVANCVRCGVRRAVEAHGVCPSCQTALMRQEG